MERLKQELLACLGEEGLKLHEMMKEHTTFRVGGAADYFIQPKSAEELRAAFEILHRYEMPVLVIGNGSNLLVRDKGIRGAVIQIYNRMAEITIEGNTIHTKGGALLSAVAARAADKGLTGLEFASGIPGSIGGAVVMNAGAYGGRAEFRLPLQQHSRKGLYRSGGNAAIKKRQRRRNPRTHGRIGRAEKGKTALTVPQCRQHLQAS